MSEWQSIETAPKDGRSILAAMLREDGWLIYVIKWKVVEGFYGDSGDLCYWVEADGGEYESYEPRYWLPLPTPPLAPQK